MKYLLDTCVLSELTKMEPSESVVSLLKDHPESDFFISSLTLGEFKRGISRLPQSKKKQKLESWLEHQMIPRFTNRFIPINDEVALQWGILLAENESKGLILPVVDGLLAASAKTYDLTLVTRNTKDFEKLDLTLINPWKAPVS